MSTGEYTSRSTAVQVGPVDDRPLTEDEQKLVQRLLSDPFAFPIAYKQWLVAFIESSEMTLPMAAIAGLNSALGIGVPGGAGLVSLPAGLIFPYGGSTPPNGALLCNGSSYLRTAQPKLFDVIGTKYGEPNATSFNVPNLVQRIPVGVDPADPAFNDRGKTGGAKDVALTEAQLPPHSHTLQRETKQMLIYAGTEHMINEHQSWAQWLSMLPSGGGAPEPTSGLIGNTGGGQAHPNMPPYVTVNYIITHG